MSELAHLQLLAEIDALVAAAPPLGRNGRRLAGGRGLPGPGAAAGRPGGRLATPPGSPPGCGNPGRHRDRQERPGQRPGRRGWSAPAASGPPRSRPTLVCRPGLTPEMLGIDPGRRRGRPARSAGLGRVGAHGLPRSGHYGDRRGSPTRRRPPPRRTASSPGEAPPGTNLAAAARNPAALRRAAGDDHAAEDIAAPGWPRNWPPRPPALGWSSCKPMPTRRKTSARIGGRCSHRSTHPGHVFLVDSLAALAEAEGGRGRLAGGDGRAGRPAHPPACRGRRHRLAAGKFPRPGRADLATLPPAARSRRRRRSSDCWRPSEEQRAGLAARLAKTRRRTAGNSRRSWENRLLGEVASRWGLSPFALVLRIYQGFGTDWFPGACLIATAAPPNWPSGARGGRGPVLEKHRRQRQADQGAPAGRGRLLGPDRTPRGGHRAGGLCGRGGISLAVGQRGNGCGGSGAGGARPLSPGWPATSTPWWPAWPSATPAGLPAGDMNCCLLAMLGVLVFRLGKNFFYDSWWAAKPGAAWGLGYYLTAAIWLGRGVRCCCGPSCGGCGAGWPGRSTAWPRAWTGAAAAAGVVRPLGERLPACRAISPGVAAVAGARGAIVPAVGPAGSGTGGKDKPLFHPKPTGDRWEGVLHFIRGQSHFRRTKIGTVPLLLIRRSLPLQVPPVAAGGLGGNAGRFRAEATCPSARLFSARACSSASGRASRQGLRAW